MGVTGDTKDKGRRDWGGLGVMGTWRGDGGMLVEGTQVGDMRDMERCGRDTIWAHRKL